MPAPRPRTVSLRLPFALLFLFHAGLAVPIRADWAQNLTADFPAAPKIFAFAAEGPYLFAGFETGIFRSEDGGQHWTLSSAGLGSFPAAFSLAVKDGTIFTGTVADGIFKSTDHGNSWLPTGMRSGYVTALAADGRNLYAGTCCNGLMRSVDDGGHWEPTGMDAGSIGGLLIRDHNVYAINGTGLFRSSDSGTSWVSVPSEGSALRIASLATDGPTLFAGTDRGLYRSGDGAHWSLLADSTMPILNVLAAPGAIFAGTSDGVSVYTETSAGWVRTPVGPGNKSVQPMLINGTKLFVGILDAGIWSRPLQEMMPGASSLQDRMRSDRAGPAAGPGWDLSGRKQAASASHSLLFRSSRLLP